LKKKIIIFLIFFAKSNNKNKLTMLALNNLLPPKIPISNEQSFYKKIFDKKKNCLK